MLINGKTIEEILRENDEKMKTKKEHMKLFDINKKLVNTYINYDKENKNMKILIQIEKSQINIKQLNIIKKILVKDYILIYLKKRI